MDGFDFVLDFPMVPDEFDDPFNLLGDEIFGSDALLSSTDSSFESLNDLELVTYDSLSDLARLDQTIADGQYQPSESRSDTDFVSVTPQSSSQSSINNIGHSNVDPEPSLGHDAMHSSKRKWEELVITFDADPDKKVVSRKRKAYGHARRKEVAVNRAVGACVQCKLRRGSCNFGLPCDQCIKRAGSVTLGQELCSRQSLVTARFNNVGYWAWSLDLLGLTFANDTLKANPRKLVPGTSKEVYLYWPNCCHDTSENTLIKIRVQDFERGPHLDYFSQPEQPILIRSYDSCERIWVPNEFCAIPTDHFPSLDVLAECSTDSLHNCNAGPFKGLHVSFSKFGENYCSMDTKLPLKQLMSKILRMKRLLAIFRIVPLVKTSSEPANGEYGSAWMELQLRYHTGKGITLLEAEILNDLERLLYGSEGIGKKNPLATWVCLWLLVLIYKEQMSFIHFHYLHDGSRYRSLYGLAKHIYNTLTAIYAALYKTTSPLTFDWRTDEINEMLGKDAGLVKLFCDIKTEMYWFHGDKDQLFSEDALFKTLVVENESRLLEAHKKIAKRKGIL